MDKPTQAATQPTLGCAAFCGIVSAFDVPCALLSTNLQTGLVKKLSGHVANSIGVSVFHVPWALVWTSLELVC